MIDQAFNSFLLTKVKLEKIVTDVTQLLWIRAAVKISSEPLQHKEPSGRKGHMAMLCYYRVERIPGTLAIVRYHARNPTDDLMGVAEDRFEDNPDDFCRLQEDVEEALLTGVDVCVMSQYEPETFEKIRHFLPEGGGQPHI